MKYFQFFGVFLVSLSLLGAKCKTQTNEKALVVDLAEPTPEPSPYEDIGCVVTVEGVNTIMTQEEVKEGKLHSSVVECLPLDRE